MGIIRNTKSVKTVLDVFKKTDEALSAIVLVERLQKFMNKTTVYRILERLEEDGILHSFTDKSGLKLFGKCKGCSTSNHTDLHPHFQCRQCGKTECLSLDISIPFLHNRKIDSAELLLIGVCEDCLT